MVKLGTNLPEHLIGTDHRALAEYLAAIEEIGYQYVTVGDHVLGADLSVRPDWKPYFGKQPLYDQHMAWHEPMVLFGLLAGMTRTLELSTGILISPQRQTALLAKQAAEVDVLSGGRLRLVVAIGWNDVEYEALGMDFTNRGRRFDEQIELMRRFWTEPVFDFEGRWHRVTAAGINPLPVQRPIPIWIGGSADRALRRAAHVADGLFPQRPLEGGWAATLEQMREWRREGGRDDDLGIDQRISIAEGGPDDWRAVAEEWRDLGATHLTLVTMGAGFESPDEHLERLRLGREALADL
jgi:probable F420-dependent oxidoreductase